MVPINAHDEPVPTAAEVNSLLAKLNAHSNSIFAYYNPDLGNYAQGKDTAKDEKARELLTVVSLIQRFQVRYRKQHASPVGPYGFSESSYEENRWVDPVPTRQATTEPREIFPEVRFAEAPQARPMPWDSVKEIQGEISSELLSCFIFSKGKETKMNFCFFLFYREISTVQTT